MPRRKLDQSDTPTKPQPRRYGKQGIIDLWEGLTDQPIKMSPCGAGHKGTTYAEDTIRLTGSQEFIESVLSRLKDLLEYDSNGSRLNLVYTETQGRYKDEETGKIVAGELTGSWAFYLRAVERSSDGKRGRKVESKNRPKEDSEAILASDSDPRFNAHLKVRAKQPASRPASQDPVYALANENLLDDKDADWWIEPSGDDDIPFTTYEDTFTAGNAIEGFKKNKAFKGVKIVAVEVLLLGKGKYRLTGQ